MRRIVLLVTVAATMAATMVPAGPVFAAGQGGGGATVEEFVCFRSSGDQIRQGTGKVITTPSGNVTVVCTGKPL